MGSSRPVVHASRAVRLRLSITSAVEVVKLCAISCPSSNQPKGTWSRPVSALSCRVIGALRRTGSKGVRDMDAVLSGASEQIDTDARKFAADFEGVDAATVIAAVRNALDKAALKSAFGNLGVNFGSLTLELSGVTTEEIGAEATFKIPVLEWELGPKAGLKSAMSQTISVTLVPHPTAELGEETIEFRADRGTARDRSRRDVRQALDGPEGSLGCARVRRNKKRESQGLRRHGGSRGRHNAEVDGEPDGSLTRRSTPAAVTMRPDDAPGRATLGVTHLTQADVHFQDTSTRPHSTALDARAQTRHNSHYRKCQRSLGARGACAGPAGSHRATGVTPTRAGGPWR